MQSQLNWAGQVFERLAPVTTAYASTPIFEAFDWPQCAAQLGVGEWYLLVFRSVRRPNADDILLEMHDYGAYLEAQRRATGLLFYFRGSLNEQRECLSFCIWSSREEAERATRLPIHVSAMRITEDMYEMYVVERYVLRKVEGHDKFEIFPLAGQSHVSRTVQLSIPWMELATVDPTTSYGDIASLQ